MWESKPRVIIQRMKWKHSSGVNSCLTGCGNGHKHIYNMLYYNVDTIPRHSEYNVAKEIENTVAHVSLPLLNLELVGN